MTHNQIPFSKAFLWILGATLLISGIPFMGRLYYLHVRERRIQDDQYKIVAIVQSAPQGDPLKTVYLTQMLDLSLDRPVNLYQFNAKGGEKNLLANPLIKTASIKKILPGTLLIQYEMRSPIAFLGEFSNTAFDDEGKLFPFRPFFTPKRLPTLYLGISRESCEWGDTICSERSFNLAKAILQQFDQLQQTRYWIKQLDLEQAQADSYGQRQVVVVLEDSSSDWQASEVSPTVVYLRLNPDDIAQGLTNFNSLQQALFDKNEGTQLKEKGDKALLIDLRIPHIAYIKKV